MSTTLSAPEKTRPRQRWTMKEARAVLAELAKSRLSPREFAAREGLDVQRLHSWRRKLESRPTFVEVRSAP